MALKYHLVKRKVLAGKAAGTERFFAQVRAGVVVPFEKLCKQISELSTANSGDVAVVMTGLIHILNNYLANGHVVQMGDLGNFRISAGSEGVEHEKDFTAKLMRKPRIIFSAGSFLRNMLKEDIGFSQFDPLTTIIVNECTQAH